MRPKKCSVQLIVVFSGIMYCQVYRGLLRATGRGMVRLERFFIPVSRSNLLLVDVAIRV